MVIGVQGNEWTIEEVGDRDPGGARAGAILQALIAREPAEKRPSIKAWLPEGVLPPQVTTVGEQPSAEAMIEPLSPGGRTLLARVVRTSPDERGWRHGCELSTQLSLEDLRCWLGKQVESPWRTAQYPVYFLWTNLLIPRILTLQVVF